MTVSGYDQRFAYIRAGPTKDLEYCRFVDEDFIGSALNTTKWSETYDGSGSGAYQDNTACGVYRMTTSIASTSNGILDRGDIRIVDPSLSPLLCVRAKLESVADTNVEMRIGLVDVLDTDHCIFEVDASVGGADLDIMVESCNGGVKSTTDTGINLDAGWHIYEIYISSAGRPYWYIDGTMEYSANDTTIDVTEFFQPYVEIYTENADSKELDVDFIKGWQKRE